MNDSIDEINKYIKKLKIRAFFMFSFEYILATFTIYSLVFFVTIILGYVGISFFFLKLLVAFFLISVPIYFFFKRIFPQYRLWANNKNIAKLIDDHIGNGLSLVLSSIELADIIKKYVNYNHPKSKKSKIDVEENNIYNINENEISIPLALATIDRANFSIKRISLQNVVSSRDLKHFALTSSLLCAVISTLYVFQTSEFIKAIKDFWQAESYASISSKYELKVNKQENADFFLRDISLTFKYPVYLNKENETIENTSGDFSTNVGTYVTLKAKIDIPIQKIELQKKGQLTGLPVDINGNDISISFQVMESESYRFSVTTKNSSKTLYSIEYNINAISDEIPKVEISALADNSDISLLDNLTFNYHIEDDHFLSKLDLVIQSNKKTIRKTVRELPPLTSNEGGSMIWYPQEWDLEKDTSITLWLEVFDNDTVTGPKMGKSKIYTVNIESAQKNHEKSILSKENLKDNLIYLLSDILIKQSYSNENNTKDALNLELQQISEHIAKIEKSIDDLSNKMEKDPLEEDLVLNSIFEIKKEFEQKWLSYKESLNDQIKNKNIYLPYSNLEEKRKQFIEVTERSILNMESFANLQRMETVISKGESLQKAGESLKSVLEESKRANKQVNMADVMNKLTAMKEQIQNMTKELAQIDRTSAEWFQNPTQETDDIQNAIKDIEKSIQAGNIDDAIKKVDKYISDTKELLSNLDQMKKQEFKDTRDTVVKDIGNAIEGLKNIANQQKKLMTDTIAIENSIQEKTGTTIEQQNSNIKNFLKHVDKAEENIDKVEKNIINYEKEDALYFKTIVDRAKHRLKNLRILIESKDIYKSRKETKNSIYEMDSISFELNNYKLLESSELEENKKYVENGRNSLLSLSKELQNFSEKIDQAQRESNTQGKTLSSKQQELKQKSFELSEKLSDYSKDSVFIPKTWSEQLKNATQFMNTATKKLSLGDLSSGVLNQQQSIESLNELLKNTEETKNKATKMDNMNASSNKNKSNYNEEQKGFLENSKLTQDYRDGKMPSSIKKTQRQEDWGNNKKPTQVKISKDFNAPESYRKEILDGMKGAVPGQYKKLSKEYYEKLVN